MTASTIAVTGATGALGGRVASLLADLGPRLVVRDLSRAPALTDADGRPLEVRAATYADGAACVTAFEGVSTLLLVSASESPTRREEHRSAISAAAAAGVEHVVYTSFDGAAPDATFTLGRDHHDAEHAIAGTPMRWTFLRDGFYLDVLPWFADETGVIRGPAGTGRVAPVARDDVADVAATVLRDPAAHAGATYRLTGPEALTMAEVADRAGRVLGRDLRYEEETVEEAYASRRAAYPEAQPFELDAWVSTYTAIADGSLAEVSGDVERLTGRPARRLEQALAGSH